MKRKMLSMIVLFVVLLAACTPAAPQSAPANTAGEPAETAGMSAEQVEWLKAAQLGPYAPEKQDWAAIAEAAKKEGKVVLYSVSSRYSDLAEAFMKEYGIEVIGYDLASETQMEKYTREWKSGVFEADVLFNNESARITNETLPQKQAWPFVPDSVVSQLAENEMSPVLVQRWSSRVLIYNTAVYDTCPVTNLWDLTTEEWKGRVLSQDPLQSGVFSGVVQTILQHPDEMAAAYEKKFGQPLTEYSEKVVEAVESDPGGPYSQPNAAIEWLYRFLQNDVIFEESTSKVGEAVGDVKQENPPVGFTTFSKIRDTEPGVYEWAPCYDAEPVFGVAYPTVLLIADRAEHPNAAKLLIKYMVEEGYAPWNVPGDYASRTDFVNAQVEEFGVPAYDTLKIWEIDPNFVYDSKYSFMAVYLELK